MAKTYKEWLKEQNNELEADAYAGHLNMLNEAVPLVKQMDIFVQNTPEGSGFLTPISLGKRNAIFVRRSASSRGPWSPGP